MVDSNVNMNLANELFDSIEAFYISSGGNCTGFEYYGDYDQLDSFDENWLNKNHIDQQVLNATNGFIKDLLVGARMYRSGGYAYFDLLPLCDFSGAVWKLDVIAEKIYDIFNIDVYIADERLLIDITLENAMNRLDIIKEAVSAIPKGQ